jgi:hypothetical protein
MDRRQFLVAAAGGYLGMAVPAGAAESKRSIIEMRRFKLRNNQEAMTQRTNDYIAKTYVPALNRAGVSPVGVFGSLIGPDSPFVLTVAQFPTVAAWEESAAKLASDAEFTKSNEAYLNGALQYVRMEVTLLRGFPSMPLIEVPKPLSGGKTRIFEIRTYESNNPKTLARKIRMFDEGEIDLFRKAGMAPVFFGETIVGRNMPNLTYMVGYDDLAAREKTWSTFVSHPEWKKMLAQPGVSDAEIVSNISNSIVRPTASSAIR